MDEGPSCILYNFSLLNIVLLLIIIVFLLFVALVSGSETAFFYLSIEEKANIKKKYHNISQLLKTPDKLLATILVANNLFNVSLIILLTSFLNSIFDFSHNVVLGFFIEVVLISFLLLFFGEVIPKGYATRFPMFFIKTTTPFYTAIIPLFSPISFLLIKTTFLFKKNIVSQEKTLSIEDISQALEVTTANLDKGEKKILESIVNFGNTDAKSVMQPRVNVCAVDINSSFSNVLKNIKESGYSRLPIYEDNLDTIRGILFIKDLLPYIDNSEFKWQSMIRQAYFVPETKKIDSLLEEFQKKKVHIAIIVDEFGGTSGIITMEDILEEVIGEIQDESDGEEQKNFIKINDSKFIFEGNTSISEFCEVMNINEVLIDEHKGEADTLAGLILELKGEMPIKNEVIGFNNFLFTILNVDLRKIYKVCVEIKKKL